MKRINPSNKLLILGLFVTLGFNVSSYHTDSGLNSLASSNIDEIRSITELIEVKGLTTYEMGTLKDTRKSGAKKIGVIASSNDYKDYSYKITEFENRGGFKAKSSSKKSNSSSTSYSNFFSELDNDSSGISEDIETNFSNFDKKSIATLNANIKILADKYKSEAKKSSPNQETLADLKRQGQNLEQYLKDEDNRKIYVIEIEPNSDALKKTEATFCTDCKEAVEGITRIYVRANEIDSSKDLKRIAKDAISKQKDDLDSMLKNVDDLTSDMKKCKKDENDNNIDSDDKLECLVDMLEIAVERSDDRYCDTEEKCEKLVENTYDILKKDHLSKGDREDKINNYDALLNIFDIDFTDPNIDRDDDFSKIKAQLVLKRTELEFRPELKQSVTTFQDAYFSGDRNLFAETAESVYDDMQDLMDYQQLNDLTALAGDSTAVSDYYKFGNPAANLYCLSDLARQNKSNEKTWDLLFLSVKTNYSTSNRDSNCYKWKQTTRYSDMTLSEIATGVGVDARTMDKSNIDLRTRNGQVLSGRSNSVNRNTGTRLQDRVQNQQNRSSVNNQPMNRQINQRNYNPSNPTRRNVRPMDPNYNQVNRSRTSYRTNNYQQQRYSPNAPISRSRSRTRI